jgi:hypothetical protein
VALMRPIQIVVMPVSSGNVVTMGRLVMDRLCRRIHNHSGHKSAQQFAKDDVNVIPDTTETQTPEGVLRCINVPTMVTAARMNTGMNVEVTVKRTNVLIYWIHMLTLQIFSDPNIALPSANHDANADLDFSEMMTVNVLQNLYVPTGTAWRMKHIKNAAITVWSLLASFLTLLDVSVIPPACHGASVTRASSVTNMATVSP